VLSRNYYIQRLLFSLLIFMVVLLTTKLYLDRDSENRLSQTYSKRALETQLSVQSLIDLKQEKAALIAISLAQNHVLLASLLDKTTNQLSFKSLLQFLSNKADLKNIRIQVIDKSGKSFYRSWTTDSTDAWFVNRTDLQALFVEPKMMQSIHADEFGLSLNTLVPVYSEGELIGVLEVITDFKSIIDSLRARGISPVLLVSDAQQKDSTINFRASLVGKNNLINLSTMSNYPNVIQAKNLIKVLNTQGYAIDKETQEFVTLSVLPEWSGESMGKLVLFSALEESHNEGLSSHLILTYLVALYLLLILLYIGWIYKRESKRMTSSEDPLEIETSQQIKAVQQQKDFLQTIIDGLSDTVMVFDKSHNVTLMNTAAKTQKVSFLDKQWTVANPQTAFRSQSTSNLISDIQYHLLSDCLASGKKEIMVQRNIDEQGVSHYFELIAMPLKNLSGVVEHVIELGHDITPYVEAKQQLELQKTELDFLAYHDSLTTLPNRTLFLDRLDQSIQRAARQKTEVALLFIDLDRFKMVNDTFGHKAGDAVLIECAKRLEHSVRETDTVSRLGGDEFTVIMDGFVSETDLITVASSLIKALADPITVKDHQFYLTASVGISVYPNDGMDKHELLKNADTAMYRAKDLGKNSYQFYTKAMTEEAVERSIMESNLRQATRNQDFTMAYQPQYDIMTNEVTGFEALIRWKHAKLGDIQPNDFIPIAEETGLIIPIGKLVLEMATATISEWHRKDLTSHRMAINVSPRQFIDKDFLETVKSALQRTQCSPKWLELEITESSVMDNEDYAVKVLNQLKNMGITVSIDDFGTGYSSLSKLKKLPIDKLKIDQSFMTTLLENDENAAIAKAIIAMSKSLNIDLLAEGVELIEQSQFLQKEGCHKVQGFLFSKPKPKGDIETLLRHLQVT